MTKTYNVSLANNQCVFDSHSGFATSAEAVDFAAGRGSKYRVYIDAGNADNTIMATYYQRRGTFALDAGPWDDDVTYLNQAQFCDYVQRNL
jgi:hypothetical protein